MDPDPGCHVCSTRSSSTAGFRWPVSLIEANRSLKTRESCPLGHGRIEKRSVFHKPNRKDKEEACQAVPGEQRKRKTLGKLFPSKLDWSTIKEVTVVNIMVFWEKGKDKGEGNKKGLRLKIIV